jgi:hypothetical protein
MKAAKFNLYLLGWMRQAIFYKGKGYTMHPVPLYGDREIKLYKELLAKGYK